MARKALLTFTSVIIVSACGDASGPGNVHDWPAKEIDGTEALQAYGWKHRITAENFDPASTEKLGAAPNTIAGTTLREIVTDPNVRVRSDGQACASCHAWAANTDRKSFCERVDDFVAQPTNRPDGTNPSNAKPMILKSLFSAWRKAQCPD